MPFKSKAQQRWMFAAEERGEVPKGTAKRWADHTPNIKKLPEEKKMRKSAEQIAHAVLVKVATGSCATPGKKIKSKGKGQGKARGKGKGPLGIPRDMKTAEQIAHAVLVKVAEEEGKAPITIGGRIGGSIIGAQLGAILASLASRGNTPMGIAGALLGAGGGYGVGTAIDRARQRSIKKQMGIE